MIMPEAESTGGGERGATDRSMNDDELELLVIGPVSPDTGGIARYISEQCTHLPENIRITTYDTAPPPGSGWRWVLRAVWSNLIDALAFPLGRPPDIVHIHSSQDLSFYRKSFYVLVSAYLWRRPVVLHIHGPSFDEFVSSANPIARWLHQFIFDASETVIALSDYWKEIVSEYAADEKIEVLPNAVDAEWHTPQDSSTPHVVFVSNHVERKGIIELIEAIDRLKSEHGLSFRVSIAGAGPLSDRSERLAEKYEDVEYLGFISEEEKQELLNDATIYALPSHADGLPIALLEGMAGGNAVVAGKVGAIPSVVGEEGGRLVRPGDVDALAEALADLVEDHEMTQKMCERNAETIQTDYTWSSVTDQLVDLYQSLVSPDR